MARSRDGRLRATYRVTDRKHKTFTIIPDGETKRSLTIDQLNKDPPTDEVNVGDEYYVEIKMVNKKTGRKVNVDMVVDWSVYENR